MTARFALCVRLVVVILELAWAPSVLSLTLRPQGRADAAGDDQTLGDAATKQKRKKALDEMRRRAEGTKVVSLVAADKTAAKMVAEPVLRYSDQFHEIIDATMWVHGAKGRPAAVQKVECYRRLGSPKYLYGLFSLSDGLIEAQWPGDPAWSATKPGVELRVLPSGPKAAPTDFVRTRQMKEAVRRFAVTRTDVGNIREEMRLLPRPLYCYRDPDAGLQDGAIFAFAANGTNPDFLMILELRGPDLVQATWNYGPVRMTTGQLSVRLDGKEVWSVPGKFGAGARFDNWLYFLPRQ